jgi:hypothetical protein
MRYLLGAGGGSSGAPAIDLRISVSAWTFFIR